MGVMEDKTKSDYKYNGQISITKQSSSKSQQWFLFLHLIQQITPDFGGKKYVQICSKYFSHKFAYILQCLLSRNKIMKHAIKYSA